MLRQVRAVGYIYTFNQVDTYIYTVCMYDRKEVNVETDLQPLDMISQQCAKTIAEDAAPEVRTVWGYTTRKQAD